MALKDKTECLQARTVLWYLVFVGFAINYLLRVNLNIAIVSMVKTKAKSNTSLTSECIAPTHLKLINVTLDNPNITASSISNVEIVVAEKFQGFEWSEYEQSLVLGAFFWLHWTTQIPGGILANKYGAKLVFGVGNFIGILLCFFIPTASLMSYKWLISLRIVQGFIAGACWPAMHSMTARWIPPNERSKFVTAYLGSSVGAGLTFPLCGIIIDLWGWEYVFYVSGILGTLWYAAWYFLVFDSPSEHPRISEDEKEYILSSLGGSVAKRTTSVPWKALLTSMPVWINVFTQFGGLWGLFTLLTHAPLYLKLIHGWNMTSTGFFAGLPHFGRMLFAYIVSIIADYLLRNNKISRTNVRKIATFLSSILQGCCMIALAQSGCNSIMALVFLTAATTVHGAVSTGALPNLVDLSPNYASVLLGFANGSGAIGGMISPLIVGLLTNNNQTTAQWQIVFWISAVILLVSGTSFLIFGKSDLQSWNSPNSQLEKVLNESELVTLNKEKQSNQCCNNNRKIDCDNTHKTDDKSNSV
ncbi:hypothetical protein RN001_014588 [Aquatica leii]|uniref:Major facilitator superfamily (MFS) profile domain-containing protein n=1 Tax=Aquatica leii TaxID=1421715 RepID=A0AAN7NY77_9COLE|nr:hypothetical protein RN001_014588 [Aquatica leii]